MKTIIRAVLKAAGKVFAAKPEARANYGYYDRFAGTSDKPYDK